jgi:hypothetical protein
MLEEWKGRRGTWVVALLLAACIISCESLMGRHCRTVSLTPIKPLPHRFVLNEMKIRGGAADESDDDDEDDEAEEDGGEDENEETDSDDIAIEASLEASSSVMKTLSDISKRTLVLLGQATIVTTKAASRAVLAAFQSDETQEEEEEEPPSLSIRVLRTLQRMWDAAMNPSEEEIESELAVMVKSKSHKIEPESISEAKKQSLSDFGSFLAKSYGLVVDRGEEPTPILGGTIGDALRDSRSKARLLVVFVPSERPECGKKNTPDHEAIRSLLSPEVSKVAEKRSRKKTEAGSFVLWGAKASSPEAITAIKRLKAKQPSNKKDKRPMLLVAYPAQVLDSAGIPKLVPRLLSQHHCSPPPSPELMAAWLNALRKRHAKQYAAMHHELNEAQLFQERKEGYKSSVMSDVQRRERERIEQEERMAKEKEEKERAEMLKRRREELRHSLPQEPGKSITDAMTIALRFGDGRTGQRRFTLDTPLSVVFNWVDATFEMERERVILTTMDGKRSFTWDGIEEVLLAESGLGRMTGLRVTEKKPEEKE